MSPLLVFLSGAAALVYEVIWVRAFGNVFGNTVHSASLVLAVFMLGLGAGAWAAGIVADRRWAGDRASSLRAYGFVELAVGALGLLVSALLPRLGDLSAAISSYAWDPDVGYRLTTASHLARYGIAVLLLFPVTFLMGATLTLMIRHRVGGDLRSAGWRIGLLYGFNTAGAAAGCFLTYHLLVPALGLSGAQRLAGLLNLASGGMALGLAASPRAAAAPSPVAGGRPPGLAPSRNRCLPFAAVALFLSGFVAMGMEILWFRHLSSLLGSYRAVLTLILTVFLSGTWLGSLAGGSLHRRFGRPASFYMLAQALFVAAALEGLASADLAGVLEAQRAASAAYLDASPGRRDLLALGSSLVPILREVGLPSLLLGATFPLANGLVQDSEGTVGRRAGLLFFADTAGAVLGSLVTGFLLLPGPGMQGGAGILALLATLGLVPLYLADRASPPLARSRRAATAAFATAVLLSGGAVLSWSALSRDHVVAGTLPAPRRGERRITMGEGVTDVIAVTEMPDGMRTLVTNGHYMSGTSWLSQRYMRAMAHLPLLSTDAPERALVIGFGTGITAHAATLHPSIRRVEVVDTSTQVLRHASYFAADNGGVLGDPRVVVYVDDARHRLRMAAPDTYDMITLEPPPISFAGVAALYSREFYALARGRLRPGGHLTQWLPAYQTHRNVALSMVRAFVDVFPGAVLLSGTMSELILMGGKDCRPLIDPARAEARLEAAPGVRADLARVSLGTVSEIVGMFVGSGETLRAAARSSRPVTDDDPIPEYAVASRLSDHEIPGEVFDLSGVRAWCPRCFEDGSPAPGLEALPTYLAILGRLYDHPAFRRHSWPYPRPGEEGGVPVPLDAETLKRVAASPYLKSVIREAIRAGR